jgi:hypothetical protein
MENKESLDTQENIGKHMEKATISYPSNTNNLIDVSRQIFEKSIEIYFDYLKVHRDYINAFQPKWVQQMDNDVVNYMIFQGKMIIHYVQIYHDYLKNVYDVKIK